MKTQLSIITYPKNENYGMQIVVCGNTEVTAYHHDEDDDQRNSNACEAASAVHPCINVCSNFKNWNGGKYAHQKEIYGWNGSYVIWRPWEAEDIPEDEEMENKDTSDFIAWQKDLFTRVETAFYKEITAESSEDEHRVTKAQIK